MNNLNLNDIRSTLNRFRAEVQNFRYPKSSKSYQTKKEEIDVFVESVQTCLSPEDYRQHCLLDVCDILRTLDKKADEVEENEQCFKILEDTEKEIKAIENSDKTVNDKIGQLQKCVNRITAIISANDKVIHAKEKMCKTIRSLEEALLPNKAEEGEENPEFLEKIKRNLIFLEQMGTNINALKASNLSPDRKRKVFELHRDRIISFENLHSTIKLKKREMLWRLPEEVFDRAKFDEDELAMIQSKLEEYKRSALNFTYPTTSTIYRQKRSEICTFANDLNLTADKNSKIKEIKGDVLDEISFVLQILDKKAEENERLNESFRILQHVEENVDRINKSDFDFQEKIEMIKEYEDMLEEIEDGADDLLDTQKQNIIQVIEKIKEEIY